MDDRLMKQQERKLQGIFWLFDDNWLMFDDVVDGQEGLKYVQTGN